MYNTYKTTENINNWNNTQPPPHYNIDTIPTAPLEPLPIISKSQKIHNLISKYEIDNLFSEKLDVLSNYEIVLLIDDSGSMNTPLVDSIHNTRWDELKEVVKIVIEVTTIFDDDGIDINFLPIEYRMSHLPRKDLLHYNWQLDEDKTPHFIKYGKVWFFSGFDKATRNNLMEQTWEAVKDNYK